MKIGCKVTWKPLSKSSRGTAEDHEIREEEHGKGPFVVIEIEPFFENNRLILFKNKDGIIIVINENLLIEV